MNRRIRDRTYGGLGAGGLRALGYPIVGWPGEFAVSMKGHGSANRRRLKRLSDERRSSQLELDPETAATLVSPERGRFGVLPTEREGRSFFVT